MKREIPIKNYFIVFIIGLITIAVVLYLATLYKNTKINDEKSIMSEYLFNISAVELDNYLLENPEIIVYWSNAEDLENEKFEKKLKKFIIKNDLQKTIIFLNTNELDKETIKNIEKKYLPEQYKSTNLDSYPLILIIKDGKINEVIKVNSENPDINYLEKRFINHGVIE